MPDRIERGRQELSPQPGLATGVAFDAARQVSIRGLVG